MNTHIDEEKRGRERKTKTEKEGKQFKNFNEKRSKYF